MEKIRYDYSKLRGRIKEYFDTQENFADSLDLSATAINNKLNEKRSENFTQDEIFYAIQRLNIQPNELIDIFFKEKVEKN